MGKGTRTRMRSGLLRSSSFHTVYHLSFPSLLLSPLSAPAFSVSLAIWQKMATTQHSRVHILFHLNYRAQTKLESLSSNSSLSEGRSWLIQHRSKSTVIQTTVVKETEPRDTIWVLWHPYEYKRGSSQIGWAIMRQIDNPFYHQKPRKHEVIIQHSSTHPRIYYLQAFYLSPPNCMNREARYHILMMFNSLVPGTGPDNTFREYLLDEQNQI